MGGRSTHLKRKEGGAGQRVGMWVYGRSANVHVGVWQVSVWACGCMAGQRVGMWVYGRSACGHVGVGQISVWACG